MLFVSLDNQSPFIDLPCVLTALFCICYRDSFYELDIHSRYRINKESYNAYILLNLSNRISSLCPLDSLFFLIGLFAIPLALGCRRIPALFYSGSRQQTINRSLDILGKCYLYAIQTCLI